MIIDLALADEQNRLERITKAQQSYEGQYLNVLRAEKGKADDNVKPNLAKLIVNTSAYFLFGAGVTFNIDDEAMGTGGPDTPAPDTAAPPVEEDLAQSESDGPEPPTDVDLRIKAILKRNKFPTFAEKLAVQGAIAGHLFVKLVPARPERLETEPRWIILNSNEVTVTWDPDDIEDVIRYKIQYNATNKDGKPVVHKQVIERNPSGATWQITDYEARRISVSTSTILGEWEELSSVEWAFVWPPIFDCQNLSLTGCYYGMADLEPDILHLINRIHFVLSNTARINRIHAHPKTIGKGIAKGQISVDVDEMILVPPTSEITTLAAAGDIAGSLDLYRALKDVLLEIAKIPPVVEGKLDNVGQLSGIALRILYGPLLELTARKKATYEPMLCALMERSLELCGYAAQTVELEWGDPTPVNEVELRANLQADFDLGVVSLETVSGKLGYDWSKEQARIKKEEADGRRMTPTQPLIPPQGPFDPNVDPTQQ